MGVQHLRSHAAAANSAPSGAPDSVVTSTPFSTRPAPTSGGNKAPKVGAVHSYSQRALHGNGAPGQPPKGDSNGGRAGAKSGHGKLGGPGPGHPMTGGQLG